MTISAIAVLSLSLSLQTPLDVQRMWVGKRSVPSVRMPHSPVLTLLLSVLNVMVKRRAKHMVNLKENGNKTKKPSPSALGLPADLHPSKVDFTLGCP